jgi:hypothetical protein
MECELERYIYMDIYVMQKGGRHIADAINLHRALRGKIEIHNRVSIDATFGEEKGTLGLIYTSAVILI